MKDKKVRKQPLVSEEPLEVDMNLLSPSFKNNPKNNMDDIITTFNDDRTKPIDKNDIDEVLEKEKERYQKMSVEKQEEVMKEIAVDVLYHHETDTKPKKKKYLLPLIILLLVLLGMIILLLY